MSSKLEGFYFVVVVAGRVRTPVGAGHAVGVPRHRCVLATRDLPRADAEATRLQARGLEVSVTHESALTNATRQKYLEDLCGSTSTPPPATSP